MVDSNTVRFTALASGDGSVQLGIETPASVLLGRKFRNPVELSRSLRNADLPPWLAIQNGFSEPIEVSAAQLELFQFSVDA